MTQVVGGVAPEIISKTRRLEPVVEIVLPSLVGFFPPKVMFRINTKPGAKPSIGHVGKNFEDWFILGGRVCQDSLEGGPVQLTYLKEDYTDQEIIDELGEDGVKLSLVNLFQLMLCLKETHERAYEDGNPNVLFVPDRKGILRAVRLYRFGMSGWGVSADSICPKHRWRCGSRVFSRLA